MADFSRQIATALRLIERNGGDVIVSRTDQSVPDANKPWRTSPATPVKQYTVRGVTLEFKRTFESQGFTAGSEDSKAILPGDMKVLIAYQSRLNATDGFDIVPGDFIQTGLGKFIVVAPFLLAPDSGDSPILYSLQVRR